MRCIAGCGCVTCGGAGVAGVGRAGAAGAGVEVRCGGVTAAVAGFEEDELRCDALACCSLPVRKPHLGQYLEADGTEAAHFGHQRVPHF